MDLWEDKNTPFKNASLRTRIVLILVLLIFSLNSFAIQIREDDSWIFGDEAGEELDPFFSIDPENPYGEVYRRSDGRCDHQESGTDWGEIIGGAIQVAAAVAPAVGMYLSEREKAKTIRRVERQRAQAYQAGLEACNTRFNAALDYSIEYGTAPINPYVMAQFCNGSPLYGSHAGYSGFFPNGVGGFGNPYLAAGYSPGFLAGMAGPYGGSNVPGSYLNVGGAPFFAGGPQYSAGAGTVAWPYSGYGSYYYNSTGGGDVTCMALGCTNNPFRQNEMLGSRYAGTLHGYYLGQQGLSQQYNYALSNYYQFSNPGFGGAPFAAANLGFQFGM